MKEFCVQTKKIDLCLTYKIQGATSEDKAYAATYTMINKMPVGASLAWRVWEKLCVVWRGHVTSLLLDIAKKSQNQAINS